MVDVKFSLLKRDFIWIGLLVVLVGIGLVYAYGGSEPVVMGHDVGELEGMASDIELNDINTNIQSQINDLQNQTNILRNRVDAIESIPISFASCSASSVSWGPSGWCSDNVPVGLHGDSVIVSINEPCSLSGVATMECNNGIWEVQAGATCDFDICI